MKSGRIPRFMSVMLFLTIAAVSVFHAYRMVWVFFDPNLKFTGGAMGLFIILCFNIALLSSLTVIYIYRRGLCERKIYKIAKAFSVIVSAVSILLACGIVIFGGRETNSVMLLYLKNDLPLAVAFVLFISLLIFFPVLYGVRKKIFAVLISLIVCLGFLWMLFPVMPYEISSEPAVFDTGNDFSVVFSTNEKGTGYVEYKFNGKDYKVYDQQYGRILSGRLIHSINIPYEHLKNNSYSIGSTRVIEDFSYGSRTGKTVSAGPYDFKVNDSDSQEYLVVSDWHTYLEQAYEAVSAAGNYDGVLLLGDPSPGMDFEEQAVKYIVEFAGKLTNGKMPVVYVRGNHETRGKFASALPSYIGYERLFYSVDRGPYSFAVLDSGEDKPDNHIEYGGLDDYRINRTDMIEWFGDYQPVNKKVIVLSHAWQVSEPEEELSHRAYEKMSQIGVRALISGHTHECRFIDGRNEQEKEYLDKYPGIVIFNDGGHKDKKYIASKLSLNNDGFVIQSFDNAGNQVIKEEFKW